MIMMPTTSSTAMITGGDSLRDRILSKARTDRADFGDLERRRQRAGTQNEREIRCSLEVASAHRDLAAASDRALDHRRTSHHAIIEDDRHVILDVLRRLVAEAATAFVVELELDDRAFSRRRVRLRIGEILTGDDRLRVEDVHRSVELVGELRRVTAEANDLAGRQRGLHSRSSTDSSRESERRRRRRSTRPASDPAESASRTRRWSALRQQPYPSSPNQSSALSAESFVNRSVARALAVTAVSAGFRFAVAIPIVLTAASRRGSAFSSACVLSVIWN